MDNGGKLDHIVGAVKPAARQLKADRALRTPEPAE
jgi:hypothetical protein